MRSYIIRRLLLAIPTVVIVTLIIFFVIRMIPGDAIDALIGQMSTFGGTTVGMTRAALEHEMGLDVPIVQQYGRWTGVWPQEDGSFRGLLQGDLGKSLYTGEPVLKEIANRLPITIELVLIGLIIGQLIALPIGVYSAMRQNTWGDYIGRSFAILCISIPGFWLGTLIIVFPSIWWSYMPSIEHIPFFEDPIGNLKMFIIPATILGVYTAGATMRITRTMMLEVLRQDYIRTAWAKGLRERVVVIRHTLKNALIPVITLTGIYVPALIGGTVIIERIFVLPGLGWLVVNSAIYRDYSVLSGIMIVFSVGLVLINLMVDLSYGFLDPRVRYR